MSQEMSISQVLTLAKICQYLNVVKTSLHTLFNGGDINQDRSELIYMERIGIQNRYNLNPNDPALRGVANYLYSILTYVGDAQKILNNTATAAPVLTGPTNQSVNVNANATFSVSVVGSGPFTYQWFDSGGNPISGATASSYIFLNSQLADSGDTFFVKVTDANGKTTTSNVATLTVTAALVGYYYQGNTDYSSDLLASNDDVVYLGTFSITTGQPLAVTFPHLGASEFVVVKYPATETTKTTYLNPPPTGPDQGTIPSIAFEAANFGGWKYIFSRTGNQFGLNNVSGTVRFT